MKSVCPLLLTSLGMWDCSCKNLPQSAKPLSDVRQTNGAPMVTTSESASLIEPPLPAPAPLPDTPLGQRLREFLDVIEANDANRTRRFIANLFNKGMLDMALIPAAPPAEFQG